MGSSRFCQTHSFPLNKNINTRRTNPAMEIIKNGIYCPFFSVLIPASSIKASPIKIITAINILFLVSPKNQSDTGISLVLNMFGLP